VTTSIADSIFLAGFMGINVLPPSTAGMLSSYLLFDPKTLRVFRVRFKIIRREFSFHLILSSLQVLRLLRLIRLLKSLASFDRVQAIAQLFDTVANCISQVLSVFVLWVIVTFTFDLM
jgi:hypothetical protein